MSDNPFTPLESGRESIRGQALLSAVATLLALTPRGNRRELLRLESLAAAMLPTASGAELLRFAQAAGPRDDIDPALVRQLLRSTDDEVLACLALQSPLVEADQLCELAESASERVAVAIARRSRLDAATVSVLAGREEAAVIDALLANPAAELAPADQARLLRNGAHGHAERITDRTDADIRVLARGFIALPGEARRKVLERASSMAPTSPGDTARALQPADKSVIEEISRLTEREDGAALRLRLAEALDLPLNRMDALINDGDGIGLVTVARALDLPESLLARLLIRSLIAVARGPRETLALVDLYRKVPRHAARFVIEAVKRVESHEALARPSQRRMAEPDAIPALHQSGEALPERRESAA
ncbi:MAG: DUF2336 domain-containing protein [Hyphomicrobiaceae bacterium]|nr:DUF2336 domain-containing protein [Hyphomicrobiaceae bacterium]